MVRIWDVRTGELLETLRGHRGWVRSVAFTPDGRGLVSGSEDKTLKHWDVSRLANGPGNSTMNFIGHKVRAELGDRGCLQSPGTGLRNFRRRLSRWPMGGEWIEGPGSSVLGCKVWGRQIDVERSHPFRSVIPESA